VWRKPWPSSFIMKLPSPTILDPNSVPVLSWGIIGPGAIAEVFVGSVQKHTAQKVVAVASRTPGRAASFATLFSIPHVAHDYDELVARADVDAIYVASYPKDHFAHAMLAIAAGKHVLVEKPITFHAHEAEQIFAAAEAAGVFAMEAMWTRYLPQSTLLQQLLAEGSLGTPELFVSQFCTDNRAVERLWTKGGGGILFDMGIYSVAMAQQFLGNPETVFARGRVRPDGIDEECSVSLTYSSGARAELVISGIASLPQLASCSFENAQIAIHAPFFVPSGVTLSNKEFYPTSETWRDETAVNGHEGLSYQATAFASYVGEERGESPVHTRADTIATIALMEDIALQIGASTS